MSQIEFTVEGHIAHVRLNRPEKMNAMSAEMDQGLFEAWNAINDNPDIWVAVLSAEGERAFCVGGDVSSDAEVSGRMAFAGGITGIGGPLLTLKKPLVCAAHGFVLGGGLELALCSDIMVAADNAQFGLPETKVGIIGECGVMHRLVRQCSYRTAMAMILTGERIKADQALQSGLVNEVVPAEQLLETAFAWANKLAAASPLAVQAAKQAVTSRLDYPLEVALSTRYEAIEAYAFSEDVKEGGRAFAEKRKPEWQAK